MTDHSRKPDKQYVRISLPVKVTGIVFWGMVLMGLLVSVVLLDQHETQLRENYANRITFIEHDLEQLYITYEDYMFDHEYMHLQVDDFFNRARQKYNLEAMRYEFDGETYQYGEIDDQQEKLSGHLLIRILSRQGVEVVDLDVYLTGLEGIINESRKQMLMVIGALVFLFGMVLQKILQKVLSEPILNMVDATRRFNLGEQSTRFDESRSDEFGYLAKFVNQALNSLLAQRQEIEHSRKALYEEKMQAEITLHSIMDGVITTDADNSIRYMNPVAENLLGVEYKQAEGQNLEEVIHLVHEETGEKLPPPTVACLKSRQIQVMEGHAALMRRDGKEILIEATASPMRSDTGDVIGSVMVLQDVSHERKLSRQLSYQASHDMLTGLYNRRKFEEQLESALLNVRSEDRHHALCYVDLDQFKIVNDTCGHVAGDELLRQLGELLSSCIREGDVLARLGGDEFGLLLQNCELGQATRVADKIRQSVKEFRFAWHDKSFEVGASIGVVGISMDNMDMANILSSADMACYAAKDMGRNRVHVYEPSDAMLVERHGQMHWAGRISRALEERRMVLYEQPVVAVSDTASVNHCEVLIRMKDENDHIVSPDAFIPAAERYNLMPAIDQWVIEEVFRNIAATSCAGGDKIVAINLSGTSLASEELLRYVLGKSDEHGVDLSMICFEITETAAISNLSRASYFMHELKKRGCRFSLDDFGSGLSSFNYLKNLPVDYLKIDGSFVIDILKDPIDRAMVEAIISVGHVLKIRVVAEWVENEETLELLKQMGVDYAQGYHLGHPREVGASRTTQAAKNS